MHGKELELFFSNAVLIVVCAGLFFMATEAIAGEMDEKLSVNEIMNACYYKNQGKDQRAKLEIILKNNDGRISQGKYLRLWKNYRGKGQLEDKSILYTLAPAEKIGINFLRWSYLPSAQRPPEQWVYLPELRMVRRVVQRSPQDSTWGVTDDDLRIRDQEEDQHRLIATNLHRGATYYTVETRPRNSESIYQKWITRYKKQQIWSDCSVVDTVYYGKKEGEKIKSISYTWRVIDKVWVWDEVKIINAQNRAEVIYRTLDVKVNVGLRNKDFKERQLKRRLKK